MKVVIVWLLFLLTFAIHGSAKKESTRNKSLALSIRTSEHQKLRFPRRSSDGEANSPIRHHVQLRRQHTLQRRGTGDAKKEETEGSRDSNGASPDQQRLPSGHSTSGFTPQKYQPLNAAARAFEPLPPGKLDYSCLILL